jgi:hypothetical protein
MLANRWYCNHQYPDSPTGTFERTTSSAIFRTQHPRLRNKGLPCLTLGCRLDERVSQTLTPARLVGNHVSNNTGSELKQRDCLKRSSPRDGLGRALQASGVRTASVDHRRYPGYFIKVADLNKLSRTHVSGYVPTCFTPRSGYNRRSI